MRQEELDTAVSHATGEQVREIRRRGFSLARRVPFERDSQPLPQWVDWDTLDAEHRQAPAGWPAGW